jgi:Metallo-beta-lactamase superfamily
MARKTKTKTNARKRRTPRRKRKPGSASENAVSSAAQGNQAAITIRMYRKGLGDCLLLGIPGRERTFWMLVDCGLILGTAEAPAKIAEIVADVAAVTDRHLDALVVTHEHWDHVSGFVQAQAAFQALDIDAVWFAWTEDPTDQLATRLRQEREEKLKKLAAFTENLQARGLHTDPVAEGVSSVLGFFNLGFGAAGGASTKDALASARGFLKGKEPLYLRPDDPPRVLPEIPAVRIYALGPPQDEKAIKKTFAKSEVYHIGATESALFEAAKSALTPGASWDAYCPFDREVGVPLRALIDAPPAQPGAESDAVRNFLDRHYLDADPGLGEKGQSWRRIDNAWLGPAADFALALDSATNNTSLVLAIEIIRTGKVILLAADAQVGNWLSWHERTWPVDGRTVTGPDLLARTVFYKVGHHGSHNATLREKGLELMKSPELVAFIPVNQEMARKKGWNEMPLPGLVGALADKTKGRLLQADVDYQAGADPASQAFGRALTQTQLYFEYAVPL